MESNSPPARRAVVRFGELDSADLVVDRRYEGGTSGNVRDDPLARLLPVGNQGGFRYRGSVQAQSVQVIALYTTGMDLDWPDELDPTTGDFVYYGDNKSPGSDLHDTQRQGNALLRDIFEWSRASPAARRRVPPIFLFEKSGVGREIIFRGLLAPGSPRLSAEDELVALWRTTRSHRFQNYRAHFTVLREATIPRAWIEEILAGNPLGENCPPSWQRWVRGRIYDALEAPRTTAIRSRQDQYPGERGMALLNIIHQHFSPAPHHFEHFAADIWLNSDPNVESVDVTRPSRDGGVDAVGRYRVGPATDPVRISFALEAKCLQPGGGGVNVRMVSRLISRLKHRDFGVLVTTAHIGAQPYAEVREDAHPVVFITGADIVEILDKKLGIRSREDLMRHLSTKYHVTEPPLRDVHVDTVAVEVAVDGPVTTETQRQARESTRR